MHDMRSPQLLIAAVLMIIGLLWIGQGSGALPGSAMSGSSFWLILGILLVVAGFVIAAREWMSRSR